MRPRSLKRALNAEPSFKDQGTRRALRSSVCDDGVAELAKMRGEALALKFQESREKAGLGCYQLSQRKRHRDKKRR